MVEGSQPESLVCGRAQQGHGDSGDPLNQDLLPDLGVAALVFLAVFPAELPDKTFVATLVLSTRYRRLPVWLGVAAAFAVQCAIAVVAGQLLTLLPQRLVLGVTFVLFAVGSGILLVSGFRARPSETAEEEEQELSALPARVDSSWRIWATSFVVLFTAEWGDLSQILTAGLAARTGDPVSVFIGAWLALLCVAGIAVLAGSWLQARVALWRVRILSGLVLAGLAAWTLVEFIRA